MALERRWGYGELRDAVLKVLREKRCATIREIAEELGLDYHKPYLRLLLKRLADRGVIRRKATGFYCFGE